MAILKSIDITVAAAATPESLESLLEGNKTVYELKLKPLAGNTNPVYIGDEKSQTWPILAGEELPAPYTNRGTSPLDTSKIFIRVTTNGEGLHALYADL